MKFPPLEARAAAPAIIRGLCAASLVFALMACASLNSSGNSDTSSIDDAITVLGGALDVLGAASTVAGARNTQPAAAPRSAAVPATNGYSQRGAFEECERLYAANGRPDLARQCRERATNMGSIR